MSRLIAFCLFALSLLLASLAIPAAAKACSCVGPSKDESVGEFYASAIKNYDAAVIAAVTDLRIIDRDPDLSGEERVVYTLRIRRSFKRFERYPEGSQIRVRSIVQSSACGLDLDKGDVVGLLLFKHKGQLHGSSCGRASPRDLRRGYRHLSDRSNRSHPRLALCPAAPGPPQVPRRQMG